MSHGLAVTASLKRSLRDTAAVFAGNVEDPHPIYAERRRDCPVMAGDIVAELGSASFAGSGEAPIFTLFKHADVLAVLRDGKRFTSGILMQSGLGPFLGDMMLTGLDGEAHRQVRGLLQPCFTPAVMEAWRAALLRPLLANEFIAPLAGRGEAELIDDMGLMFPIRVVYAVMGFEDDPGAIQAFAATALKILAGPSPDPATKAAAFQAFQDLYEPTLRAVETRRRRGVEGDDLMARLMRAEFEGRSLSDHDITNFLRMILPAAAETTTRTFGNLMVHLLSRPELLARLRQDRTLVRQTLDESMRYEPVTTFKVRQVASDFELRGVSIPAGAVLSCCVPSANRDEEAFERPEAFDIDRERKASFTFGFGPHMCLGLWLAKAEIEEAVNGLLDLPNLRLDPSRPPPATRGIQLRGPEAVHVVWDA